ncbi:MAG: group II intron maturase-specific domain-containing protein [Sporolactobacillus sp.]
MIVTLSAKQGLIYKLKRITRRNRSGTFSDEAREINQMVVGWINYFAIGSIRRFLQRIRQRLNYRLHQLIWKGWKKCVPVTAG